MVAAGEGLPDAPTRRYALAELGIWQPRAEKLLFGGGRATADERHKLYVAYAADPEADGGLCRQRGALRAALLLARLLKRTLVLPPFWSTPRGGGRAVGLSYFYDYAAFAEHWPHHREASALRALPSPTSFHIALDDEHARAEHEGTIVFKARSRGGALRDAAPRVAAAVGVGARAVVRASVPPLLAPRRRIGAGGVRREAPRLAPPGARARRRHHARLGGARGAAGGGDDQREAGTTACMQAPRISRRMA